MKQNVYTVSQVNSYIKNMFAQDFLCSSIMIKGELSNVKYHGSGHIYFTLKDTGAAISCVMFAGNRGGLSFRMEAGQQVVVGGSLDVYERDGKYQLYARQIERLGDGYLYEQYEKLKKELAEMGMFDTAYKTKIPFYVRKLGVVTAQTGAAVRDIINVAKRRNPFIEIVLYPAIVQGDQAVCSIINGIHALEREDVDVMIVGRGGGSIEDLWAFNHREVAQAVFDCSVPIISAVGHETDTTIIDYVADLRAPTPSAAAELAVCDMAAVVQQLYDLSQKCKQQRLLTENMELRLRSVSPQMVLRQHRMRILSLEEQLSYHMERKLAAQQHRLEISASRLEALSPLAKLKQGYAYVTKEEQTLTSTAQITRDDQIRIYLQDGYADARIEETYQQSV